jgi:hypothetical protein
VTHFGSSAAADWVSFEAPYRSSRGRWRTTEMPHGFVYIARNERHPEDTFKVGMTKRSVPERLKELTEETSNLGDFSAVAYFMVSDIEEAERTCHERLANYRVQRNREFFRIPLALLVDIVRKAVAPLLTHTFVSDSVCVGESHGLADRLAIARRKSADLSANGQPTIGDDAAQRCRSATRTKALQLCHELASEDLLKYEICDTSTNATPSSWVGTFFVLSRITDEPLRLCQRGHPRAGTGADAPDDGCIGSVSIYCGMKPRILVRGRRIRYDGLRGEFATSGERERDYSDPDDAMRVVADILVANLASPQTNVRSVIRETSGGPFVYDCGVFDLSAFDA